jgi:hypothetical protein
LPSLEVGEEIHRQHKTCKQHTFLIQRQRSSKETSSHLLIATSLSVALHVRRLLAGNNAPVLVVLQIGLRQSTTRHSGSAMHNLRSRTHSLHLFKHERFSKNREERWQNTPSSSG